MKTDRVTKLLLLVIAAGLWTIAASLSRPVANAQAKDAAQSEIRARKIVLVDENGKTRISLNTSKNDVSGIVINDAKENARIVIGTDSDDGSPRLHMMDEKQNLRAILYTYKGGSAGLTLVDDEGNIRAMFSEDKAGSSALRLIDPKGKTLFNAP